MGDDKRDTPPTGTAIPRPRRDAGTSVLDESRTVPVFDFTKPPSSSPPPVSTPTPTPTNPTLEDIYKLIDARLSTKIVERISSSPPPEATVQPRPSMPVRAAKATGRWTKWAMAALGVMTIVGEIWADLERYRGPISQLLVIVAKQMDAHEAPELAPPEPISPLLPDP